ncbi:UNKNOWN [Stylonychia lemnae]|uniref:Uncharacterized protein n=1 Tax=Stylonychia lemnae TaxID=5949 RepID=A0A077ZTK4_STYLE|nr:UNKNOWN [Stylonychia lemnae]|eukprot:CDW73217.1 UNKNOWN [Stylonychia lemnae]
MQSNSNIRVGESKKRKLPQSTINTFFSQSSQKSSKRLKQNDDQQNKTQMIDITKNADEQQIVSDQKLTKTQQKKVIQEEEKKQIGEIHQEKTLQKMFQFELSDMKSIDDFDKLFCQIADLLLNQYVLTINKIYKYRISEIEFYFNENNVHQDTFTHGDDLQKQMGQWYFHRFGKTYKVGTYKGMDLSFGKGPNAFGGILIRAISSLGAEGGKQLPPNEFIEGPCNSVNRILEHNSTEKLVLKEIKDFVVLDNFKLDAFEKGSRLYLSHLNDSENEVYRKNFEPLKVWRCPRVGLTLKRFDEHKCKFWMADYRFLIFPEKHKKMNNFIIMSMLKEKMSIPNIAKSSKSKAQTVEEIFKNYQKGLDEDKKKISDFKDVDMKNEQFAFVYGLHQKASIGSKNDQ